MAVHSLSSCPIPTPARVDLDALGDFPTTAQTSESLSLTAQNVKLGLPLDTLALEARASSDFSDQAYIGYAPRSDLRLDVLLWPQGSVCDLSSGGSYPDRLGGQALGYGENSGLLMVAGSDESESPSVVGALTFDTRTGVSEAVDPRVRSVLSVARAFATISDFGSELLVAGGEDSLFESAPLNDSAELYDPVAQSFEPELLKLAVPRARHAAVNLRSGEVALLGGSGPDTSATSLVEVVTPSTRTSKLVDSLWFARSSPVALQLSDGRVFVAGGIDRDGHPVPGLEWREADATLRLDAPFDGSTELPARFDRAFVALPGGAVLAVGGCEDRDPAANEDCRAFCAHGCPPLADTTGAHRYDAYWISPEGTTTPLNFPLAAGQPVLLPGSDGRPWLIASDGDSLDQAGGAHRQLYRFDPWHQSFELVAVDLGLDAARSVPQFVALGSDAFVWLDQREQGPVLHGMRLGTRSLFSNDTDLVQQRDADDATSPAHLSPDHVPGPLSSYDSASASLSFEPTEAGSQPACVWLTDARFADFSAQIEFSGLAPSLRLGDFSVVDAASPRGEGACTWPAHADAASSTLTLTRNATHLDVKLGEAQSECTLDDTRLPLAVCASDLGASRVTRLRVTRSN